MMGSLSLRPRFSKVRKLPSTYEGGHLPEAVPTQNNNNNKKKKNTFKEGHIESQGT